MLSSGLSLHFGVSAKARQGFTLIELILYIGIFAIVFVGITTVTLNVFRDRAKVIAINEVSQNSRFAMERIIQTVRNANTILDPATSTNSTILKLKMSDSNLDPTYIDFANSAIQIKQGSSATSTLTASEVTVTNLQFTNGSYTTSSGAVKFELTIKHTNPGNFDEYSYQKTLYGTANIRKR